MPVEVRDDAAYAAVHPVTWTRERIGRYWAWFTAVPGLARHYFSAEHGPAIVALARRAGVRAGRVLDYGCGSGDLLAHLLRSGFSCEGVDFSAGSVADVRRRFAADPHFLGAHAADRLPTPVPDASHDTVFCVEVVEHLLAEDVEPTLAELARLARPGGMLIVTTPHAEDLVAGQAVCPECGCLFHRYQHLRAWTPAQLSAALERHGFRTVRCEAVRLGERAWERWLRSAFSALTRRRAAAAPHLVYIGARRG